MKWHQRRLAKRVAKNLFCLSTSQLRTWRHPVVVRADIDVVGNFVGVEEDDVVLVVGVW